MNQAQIIVQQNSGTVGPAGPDGVGMPTFYFVSVPTVNSKIGAAHIQEGFATSGSQNDISLLTSFTGPV